MTTAARVSRRPNRTSSRVTRKPSPSDRSVAGVRITHGDRVLYPDAGITKLEVAQYFERISEWMLPHVAGRPLTLVRCPEGIRSGCFYMKHSPWERSRNDSPECEKIRGPTIGDAVRSFRRTSAVI